MIVDVYRYGLPLHWFSDVYSMLSTSSGSVEQIRMWAGGSDDFVGGKFLFTIILSLLS